MRQPTISFAAHARESGLDKKNSQLEESIRDLQHEDMRMVVFMANQDALTSPSHTITVVMFL
jgi:hypothetical protein